VAVHYIKLIDFTFGGKLKAVVAGGQRGLVGPADGPTWDSCQMKLVYEYDDGREAAFDIHTSWVTPDNFPGYVEQEVQFRFDNGVWNGHSRKRGVELTVEGETPISRKTTINNHYNGTFLEPWGERSQRGYGVEVIERFFREVAIVEYGGDSADRPARLAAARKLAYNDLAADRQVVAAVQALEAVLEEAAAGRPDGVVRINGAEGGLVLQRPGSAESRVLYEPRV
jgi:predicted dehydrogenase